jgi:hypothetical protein
VSRAGQRHTTSYNGHQNRLAIWLELIAARGALGPACTDHVGPTVTKALIGAESVRQIVGRRRKSEKSEHALRRDTGQSKGHVMKYVVPHCNSQ